MNFDFFTFGGALFWEDVFFYQKWRIQRHCITKKYRLLDSWDIRRASGTFEKCRKTFIEYMESYEITKQPNRMIILLHGYGEGKNIFKNLWRKFVLTNVSVASINYPSLFRSSRESALQLLFFLNHMEGIEEVSFVTKGAGNLILEQALNMPIEYQTFTTTTNIKNIVEINPIIKECFWCEMISKIKIFNFIFGPMINDMTKQNLKNSAGIPLQLNHIRIYCESRGYRFFAKLFGFSRTDTPNNKKNNLNIKTNSFKTLNSQELLNFVVKFINNGKI